MTDPSAIVTEALSDLPGRPLFVGLSGSRMYGLATETSDHDIRGVYQRPTSDFLGVHPARDEAWERKPDLTLWELGHFCRLLLKGNPNIVEMLWMPDEVAIIRGAPAIEALLHWRDAFLTRQMGEAYLGWVGQEMRQFDAMEGRFPGKRAHHIPRLLAELESALDGDMRVRPEGPALVWCREVKSLPSIDPGYAAWFAPHMRSWSERLRARLGELLPEPPTAFVNDLLLEARRIDWGVRGG